MGAKHPRGRQAGHRSGPARLERRRGESPATCAPAHRWCWARWWPRARRSSTACIISTAATSTSRASWRRRGPVSAGWSSRWGGPLVRRGTPSSRISNDGIGILPGGSRPAGAPAADQGSAPLSAWSSEMPLSCHPWFSESARDAPAVPGPLRAYPLACRGRCGARRERRPSAVPAGGIGDGSRIAYMPPAASA